MTTYCYTNEDGVTIEQQHPMGLAPRRVTVDGVRYDRDFTAEWAGSRKKACDTWPLLSDALAVDPSQIKEQRQALQAKGVSADFTSDGRMVLESRGHRRSVLRALGYHDKDAGYGD